MTVDLSIIIPIYNSQKYLKKCLDSVCHEIKKNNKNIEVILIDDASADNSKKICRIYKKKFTFIKYIYSKKNLGVSVSRNKGIKKSKGNYILFLDSDDQLSSNSINYILNVIVNSSIDYYFIKSRLLNQKNIDHNEVFVKNFKYRSFFSHIRNLNKFRATCWNFLIKKSFITKHKIYFDNIRVFEDQIFVAKILFFSKNFTILNKPIYERRIHEPYSLSSVIGHTVVVSSIKILTSLLRILIRNESKHDKFEKFLVSRVNFVINQLLLNVTICSDGQIKKTANHINFLRKIYYKISITKKDSNINRSLKIIKNIIKKNFLLKYKNEKLSLLKNFTKKFKYKKIIIFCGGSYAKVSLKLIKNFKIKVLYVVDNNKNFLNKKIENNIIKNINYLKKYIKIGNANDILVCNQNYADFFNIKRDLLKIGIKKYNIYHFKI